MATKSISINRAPVLTLWAAVVARRLGFDEDEDLSLGKALAGLNAQAKGRLLGVFKPHEQKAHQARQKKPAEEFAVELCGRPVPARNTEAGVRALRGAQAVDPAGVRRYLEGKFGEHLAAVRTAMEKLARAYPPQELAEASYPLYERFRPAIPAGVRGWGAKGTLDLGLLERLAKERP
jgi:hypothetical protein